MPRTKPLVRMDEREEAIRKEIGAIRGRLMITQNELAKRAGICPATLSLRLKSNGTIGDMRLSEYWAIQDVGKRG